MKFQIEPIAKNDTLSDEKKVFIRTFVKAYKDIPLKVLKIDNLLNYLHHSFQEEIDDFKKGKEDTFFYHAMTPDKKVVAYSSFEVHFEKRFAYIRQLAVDPDYWFQGIGKRLVFKILEDVKELRALYLNVRKTNTVGIDFYHHIGFKKSSFLYEKLDSKIYIGLELNL